MAQHGPASPAALRAQIQHERVVTHRIISIRTAQVRHYRAIHKPDVDEAIAIAALLGGLPEADMRRVAYCESRFNPRDRNSATATGLFQFLDSTWASYPFRRFSVYDPYANAAAAAYVVRQDGGWHQWVCKP